MEIKCTRNCVNKSAGGTCSLPAVAIGKDGCEAYIEAPNPEFKPFETDNVVVFDNAGIPSIMVRFKRITSKELFGGLDRVHPAFIIDGNVYDEIYISKYPNVIINGRAYSLPMQVPETNISFDNAVKACRSKGKGWHLMTAMERGLIADICWHNQIFPHGNTEDGKWYKNRSETGQSVSLSDRRTLTGSGPNTWSHDHTRSGVFDLCGNVNEWIAGLRLNNGVLQSIPNNDAAAPVDIKRNSSRWENMLTEDGKDICIDTSYELSGLEFTAGRKTEKPSFQYNSWGNVKFDFEITDEMKELGLHPGELNACFSADGTGECLSTFGGNWADGSEAGIFHLNISSSRSAYSDYTGFRSAYYCKKSLLL